MKIAMNSVSASVYCLLVCLPLSSAHARDGDISYTTGCDDKCGDSSECRYTCCHTTWEEIGGIKYPKQTNCNSSTCCLVGTRDGGIKIPEREVHGVSAPIKFALVGKSELCGVQVRHDEGTKIVDLNGAVASEALKREASAIAAEHAKGYKIKNNLTIEKPADRRPFTEPTKKTAP